MRACTIPSLVGFAGGVAWLQTQATLPAWPLVTAALVSGAAALFANWAGGNAAIGIGRGGRLSTVLAVLLAAVAGYGYAAWRAEVRLADALPVAWEGVDLRLIGVIDDLPASSPRGTRFAFAVERVLTAGAVVPQRLSLAWYGEWSAGTAAGAVAEPAAEAIPELRAGERWALTVRLKRPHGSSNPGGFDLEAWLLERNLRATGVVRRDSTTLRLDEFAGRATDQVQRARSQIRERIVNALQGAPYTGVIVALAVGDQRSVPEVQWTLFNRTGVGHLVSISGLHVTVFASAVGALALVVLRRVRRLTNRWPARHCALVAGVACAWLYVLLAGAEVPAVRTGLMLTVAAMGAWWSRPGTAAVVWAWALAIVLLVDPWATLGPGFWLSFGAVGLLLYAGCGRLALPAGATRGARLRQALHESTHAQWVVTAGLLPFTLALFGQVSLVAPLANAVAIPVVTLVVVPLTLMGVVLPVDVLFVAAHAALSPLMDLLQTLAATPAAIWQQHRPPTWAVVAGLVACLWLLAPRGVPGRALGLVWLLPLFLARPPPPAPGAFRLTVLDVGQGLAAVVQTHRHVLAYDTGPRYHETADAGGRIVAPFLRATGSPRLDALIVSHIDLDHSGGALTLLQTLPVAWLASSLALDHPLAQRVRAQGLVVECIAGQRWTWDGVEFTILHPALPPFADVDAKTNDRSCVLRVEAGGRRVLLTGDIEARSEAALLRADRDALRAEVLVVPHHGSRTSSTPAFVAAVDPAIAIFSAGYRNRFNHPRADVVRRYVERDAAIVRTDRDGAVTIEVGATGSLKTTTHRELHRRYWHDPYAPDASALQ